MKEGEKRRSRQEEEATRGNPDSRLAAELKFITTETSSTQNRNKKKVKDFFFFQTIFFR